jgi:predicted RNase H-like HicB family nuclease
MASTPSTISVPLTMTVDVHLTVDVHPIDGGGFYGEVRQLPGCLAQADSLEGLQAAIRDSVRDYFAEPGLMTEETARKLAAIQGTDAIPEGPYPLHYPYQPPPSWTEADEDE